MENEKNRRGLDPSNYRSIVSVNYITKIFTQILSDSLTNGIDTENLLPEFEAGFRKSASVWIKYLL